MEQSTATDSRMYDLNEWTRMLFWLLLQHDDLTRSTGQQQWMIQLFYISRSIKEGKKTGQELQEFGKSLFFFIMTHPSLLEAISSCSSDHQFTSGNGSLPSMFRGIMWIALGTKHYLGQIFKSVLYPTFLLIVCNYFLFFILYDVFIFRYKSRTIQYYVR